MESKLYWQVEESEPRNKLILIDLGHKSIGGSKGLCPLGRRAKPEKGRQRVQRTSVGRGKSVPPPRSRWGKSTGGGTSQSA